MSAQANHGTGGRRATNTLLAVIAGVLVFQTADRLSVFEPAKAEASQDSRSGGLVSAAAQRQEILRDLKAITARLTAIEKQLQGELRVRVTDMPEIKIPRERETERKD